MKRSQAQETTEEREARERLERLRAAASLGNFQEACASQWIDAWPKGEAIDTEREIPVWDLGEVSPLAKSDVVVMSDGLCYSKSTLQRNVDAGVTDVLGAGTGIARLPLSNKYMTEDDYRRIGRRYPASFEQQRDAIERSLEEQIASHVERTPAEERAELLSRYERWKEHVMKGGPLAGARPQFLPLILAEGRQITIDERRALVSKLFSSVSVREVCSCGYSNIRATARQSLGRSRHLTIVVLFSPADDVAIVEQPQRMVAARRDVDSMTTNHSPNGGQFDRRHAAPLMKIAVV